MKVSLLIAIVFILFTACTTQDKTTKEHFPTTTQVPNCAADGLGCEQFNPDL